ncbi:MAG: hypothetical protein C5B49_12695 [Bdellovibrio sp.]|nr:MAG: hypothetical protein C5B49_12695 [Bdellovibrio sp.]
MAMDTVKMSHPWRLRRPRCLKEGRTDNTTSNCHPWRRRHRHLSFNFCKFKAHRTDSILGGGSSPVAASPPTLPGGNPMKSDQVGQPCNLMLVRSVIGLPVLLPFLLPILLCLSGLLSACAPAFRFSESGPTFSSHTPSLDLATSSCGSTYSPGHAMIHRLSNTEYNNTVRDLLLTKSTPGDTFQSSSVGSSGFSNESVTLTISNQSVADYATAARALADEVIASKGTAGGAYQALASCAVGATTVSDSCARSVIRTLARRAFRQAVTEGATDSDVDRLMAVYSAAGGSFDLGFHAAIMAMLLDPRFIFTYFNHPQPDNPQAVYLLNDYELASRLSFFIWQSMPDDTLLSLADQGVLHNPETLQAQAARMLLDPKAQGLATILKNDWAKLSKLRGASISGLDQQTLSDMLNESQLFINDVISTDASFLTAIDGRTTFVNANLAKFYGWNVPSATTSNFVKTTIQDSGRRGLLTQAAMMVAFGGGGLYTHPVQRGRFVTDAFLCAPPPPPPGGKAPAITPVSGSTMKQVLTQMTSPPACYACHNTMNVVGLGLENFDPFGKWRTVYSSDTFNTAGASIDASGTMPNSFSFQGPGDFLDDLSGDPRVPACLATKLMSVAIARVMSGTDDLCIARAIGASQITPNTKFSDAVKHIVLSLQFTSQLGGTLQ